MTVSEFPSRRELRESGSKSRRKASVVTAGVAVAVSSAAVVTSGNSWVDGDILAYADSTVGSSNGGGVAESPRQTTVIPAAISGGDELVEIGRASCRERGKRAAGAGWVRKE